MSGNTDIEVNIQSTEQLQQKKKRGRPKIHKDRAEYLKQYQQQKYLNDEQFRIKMKEKSNINYKENKDEIIAYQKQLQERYRIAFNILKKMKQHNKIPSEYKDEVNVICV
jgi:hypothetical protein